MESSTLQKKINALPSELQKEVVDFIEFLLEKTKATKIEPQPKKRQFGAMKGKIWLADDFDAPLPEFEEYTH